MTQARPAVRVTNGGREVSGLQIDDEQGNWIWSDNAVRLEDWA